MQLRTTPDVGDLESYKVFLAGGISNCEDWQAEIVKSLKDEDVILFNPRRPNFNMDDPEESRFQIEWEYRHLREADIVAFWFPSTSICPITLMEFGRVAAGHQTLLVGADPEYPRHFDLEVQLGLSHPEQKVISSLDSLANSVRLELFKRRANQARR